MTKKQKATDERRELRNEIAKQLDDDDCDWGSLRLRTADDAIAELDERTRRLREALAALGMAL